MASPTIRSSTVLVAIQFATITAWFRVLPVTPCSWDLLPVLDDDIQIQLGGAGLLHMGSGSNDCEIMRTCVARHPEVVDQLP